MKQFLILFAVSLFITTSVHSQRLYDNGPLTGDGNYVLAGAKWNSTTLKYYIYNTSSHLTASQRESAIQTAFNLWSNNSVLTFTQVTNPSQADIKIKWVTGDHGDGHPFDGASGVLAHAFYPPPIGGTYAGELHFDDGEAWSLNGSGIDLITVAAHEIGHLLGIGHSDVSSALMYPYYNGINRNLHSDDILAVWVLYECGSSTITGTYTQAGSTQTLTSFNNCSYTGGTITINLPSISGVSYSWTGAITGTGHTKTYTPASSQGFSTTVTRVAPGCTKSATFTFNVTYNTGGCVSAYNPDTDDIDVTFENAENVTGISSIAQDNKTIVGINPYSTYKVRLFNFYGAMLKEIQSSGEAIHWNISWFPKGIYIIYIYDLNRKVSQTKKIVKQ
jgi:hypothetical protein